MILCSSILIKAYLKFKIHARETKMLTEGATSIK